MLNTIGIEEFNTYISNYEEPQKLNKKHSQEVIIIFKYGSDDKDNNFLITNFIIF